MWGQEGVFEIRVTLSKGQANFDGDLGIGAEMRNVSGERMRVYEEDMVLVGPPEMGGGGDCAVWGRAANCGSAVETLFRIYNQYGANNNGNLMQQDVADNGTWLVQQAFTYDKLNRLETATEGTSPNGWKQTFGYDRWGNRWLDTNGTNSYGVRTSGIAISSSWYTAKNRLALLGSKGGHDEAGNQVSSDSFTLDYDGENRMVSSVSGTMGTQSYGYL